MSKFPITIACCVSNTEVFEKCLVNSLKNLYDDLDVDVLPIYNLGNPYTAAMAGNLALELSKTRYVLFVHQDLEFLEGSGKQIKFAIQNSTEKQAIIGVAGIKIDAEIDKWGFAVHKNPMVGTVLSNDGELVWFGSDELSTVHSIDEIFMLIDKNSDIRFDPTWMGFHLFGLDMCLRARLFGYEVVATKINVCHWGKYSSSIYSDHNFIKRIVKLHRKWRFNFSEVFAPYCHWANGRIVSYVPYGLSNKKGERIDVSRLAVILNS